MGKDFIGGCENKNWHRNKKNFQLQLGVLKMLDLEKVKELMGLCLKWTLQAFLTLQEGLDFIMADFLWHLGSTYIPVEMQISKTVRKLVWSN